MICKSCREGVVVPRVLLERWLETLQWEQGGEPIGTYTAQSIAQMKTLLAAAPAGTALDAGLPEPRRIGPLPGYSGEWVSAESYDALRAMLAAAREKDDLIIKGGAKFVMGPNDDEGTYMKREGTAPDAGGVVEEPRVFWCGSNGMVEELPHDDGCWTRYVFKRDYDTLRAEAERLREDAERAFHHIERAMMPDPNDEREISVDWLRKEIRAAIDAARKEKP